MKKALTLIIALLMLVAFVSCGETPVDTSATAQTDATTSTEATTAEKPDDPIPEVILNDVVYEDIGEYLRLMYNPAYCTVTYETKAALGSKESATFTIEMKEGYIFDGWTTVDIIPNLKANNTLGKVVTENVFTVEATEDDIPENSPSGRLMVIPNYSVSLNYDANGGKAKDGSSTFTQTYPVTWYKCPTTLPAQGYFVRDGYTLVEYNTKADGTGYGISLGSRTYMADEPSINLYCIWEKQNDASEFTYTTKGKNASITSYTGTSDTIVFPDTIGGKTVAYISGDFEAPNATVKKIVLPENLRGVESYAFSSLYDLEELVMFDYVTEISDSCFDSEVFTKLRVNAKYDLFSNWQQVQTTLKLDRLVYAMNSGRKMFLIYGGSGALNGLDSAQIDEALNHEYIVINMGSNAQASAAYYFDWFEDVVDEDDIILWMPECGNWMLGENTFHNRLWEVNTGNYDNLRYIDISKFERVFDSYTSYAWSHEQYQKSWERCSINYTPYGDAAGIRESKGSTYSYRFQFSLSGSSYDYMASLITKIAAKGTTLFYTYAAVDQSAPGTSQKDLEGYRDTVIGRYKELVCISEYTTPYVENSMMYDSEWHLTNAGAVYRTEKLTADIVKALEK